MLSSTLPPDRLGALVESAAIAGQVASGRPLAWITAQSDRSQEGRRSVVVLSRFSSVRPKAPRWTSEEDSFLRTNLGVLSEVAIASHLGRTQMAVHLRWSRDLKLPAPSKHPDVITGQGIAKALNVDVHAVMKLIDRGILPGRRLPGERVIRAVDRRVFVRWVVNPANWIYFNPQRVRDSHLRRLVELKRERWNDEWWTPGQVARFRGVNHRVVNQAVRKGRLPAVKWGNWWILRSDAIRMQFCTGKGNGPDLDWSEGADAFVVLASAVGLSSGAIAVMMGWTDKRVLYRLSVLRRERSVERLVQVYGLRVHASRDARTGDLFADWKDYRDRFPRLARAMERLDTSQLSRDELGTVRGVLFKWAVWSGNREIAHSLLGGTVSQPRLRAACARLREAGADPFEHAASEI